MTEYQAQRRAYHQGVLIDLVPGILNVIPVLDAVVDVHVEHEAIGDDRDLETGAESVPDVAVEIAIIVVCSYSKAPVNAVAKDGIGRGKVEMLFEKDEVFRRLLNLKSDCEKVRKWLPCLHERH